MLLDELSLRKALTAGPESYFLLRDRPCDRWFLASALRVAVSPKVQVNRETSPGFLKGKLVIDLRYYRQLVSLDDLHDLIMADVVSLPYRSSACLSEKEVPSV